MSKSKFKYQFDRFFKFKVNDDVWHGFLITEEEAAEIDTDEEGFRALTDDGDKCIYIVEGNVTKGIINHELFHLYVYYLGINSANLTVDQFEEVIAELLENNLERFIKKRNTLYKKFKKLEENR